MLMLIEPFNPLSLSFFKIIFNIPDDPSALYLDDGFVIISTLSISLPCNCLKAFGPSNPIILAGLPSIKILTLCEPLRLMLPSISKSMDGMFSRISSAVPPLLLKSLPTLNTLLSNFNSKLLFSALTVTPSRFVASVSKLITCRSTFLSSLVKGILIFFDL